jgi:hypothetical protein
MPDDTPDNYNFLDDAEDDGPDFLRTTTTGNLPSKSSTKSREEPKPAAAAAAPAAAAGADPAVKKDNRVYKWAGEDDDAIVEDDEEKDETHLLAPETSPETGRFSLSGVSLDEEQDWKSEGAGAEHVLRRPNTADLTDLAGNPIAPPASPGAAEEEPETSHTPPPEEYVWEGDLEEAPAAAAPEAKSKPKPKKPADRRLEFLDAGTQTLTAEEVPIITAGGPPPVTEQDGRRGKPSKFGRAPKTREPRARGARQPAKLSVGAIIGVVLAVLAVGGAAAVLSMRHTSVQLTEQPVITILGAPELSISYPRPQGWMKKPLSEFGIPGSGVYILSDTSFITVTVANATETTKLEDIHAAGKNILAKKFPGLSDGQTQTYGTRDGGIGTYTEWTTKGDFFHEGMHGYRVSILNGGRSFMMFCGCPEKNWKVLKPAFGESINRVGTAPPQ